MGNQIMNFYKVHWREILVVILLAVIFAYGLFVVFFKYSDAGEVVRTKITCRHFKNQPDAQKALKDNPRLDGDKDGLACNSYFK